MTHVRHIHGDARYALVRPLFRCSASIRRSEWGSHGIAALFFGIAFVLQVVNARNTAAAPPHYRVGACLAARELPPSLQGETTAHYSRRMIADIENIADAIKYSLPKGVDMAVDHIILAKEPDILPGPRACMLVNEKRKYDIWLVLTYEAASFTYQVSQRGGEEVLEANPEPLPDAARTRALLAEAGARIAGKSVLSTVTPVQVVDSSNRGIIFLYDSSGSMLQTDPGALYRLGVEQRIGEIIAHASKPGEPPIPFAVVVFADRAVALEREPGVPWFETTPDGLDRARTQLGSVKDIGNTNIGAAFAQVEQLISSRKKIGHWHVVFLTDGEPTAGVTSYAQIKNLVTAALGGKSTLSAIVYHGSDSSRAGLADLVRATLDGSGHSGEIIDLKVGDTLETVSSSLDRIAFLINQSTVRDEAALICTQVVGAPKMECELDQSRPHALRFGAAQKVTFIVDMAAFPGGRCTVAVENQGLGSEPRTIELPAGRSDATLTDPSFTISLSRSSDRVFLTIDMTKGRLNGDWKIKLTAEAAKGGPP